MSTKTTSFAPKTIMRVVAIALFVSLATFGMSQKTAFGASQAEGDVPTSGDLCNGTGGNGKITRVGDGGFTIEQPDGRRLAVRLKSGATVKTSGGPADLSGLRVGESVTLIGDRNADNTFAAESVVLCSQAGGRGDLTKRAAEHNQTVSRNLNLAAILIAVLLWTAAMGFLRFRRDKSFLYLIVFSVFYLYVCAAIDRSLIQFQLLLLANHFAPGLLLNGLDDATRVNLAPLVTLAGGDLKTSLLNILLFVPFGIGLPLLTGWRTGRVLIVSVLVSIAIETLQRVTGLIGGTTFRIADINDVIFNTLGAALGCAIFLVLGRWIASKGWTSSGLYIESRD